MEIKTPDNETFETPAEETTNTENYKVNKISKNYLIIISVLTILIIILGYLIYINDNSDDPGKDYDKTLYEAFNNSISVNYLVTTRTNTSNNQDQSYKYNIISDVTNPKVHRGELGLEYTFTNNNENKITYKTENIILDKDMYVKHVNGSSLLSIKDILGIEEGQWIYSKQDLMKLGLMNVLFPGGPYESQSALGDIIIGNFGQENTEKIIEKIKEYNVYEVLEPPSVLDNTATYKIKVNYYAVEELNYFISELIDTPYEKSLVYFDEGTAQGTIKVDLLQKLISAVELTAKAGEEIIYSKREFSYPTSINEIKIPDNYIDYLKISENYDNNIPEECKTSGMSFIDYVSVNLGYEDNKCKDLLNI